jgi:hypothetical protein
MKFLCLACDEPLRLKSSSEDTPGGLRLSFQCEGCGNSIAMLTNPGETQLVQAMNVKIGGAEATPPAFEGLRESLQGLNSEALVQTSGAEPTWSKEAESRLRKHPRFVQPVIRKRCEDYAYQAGLSEITPDVMDSAQLTFSRK